MALLVVAVAGCTAPGEPPAHPSTADYHDLMRRETGMATSTIATMQVVVGESRRGRITQNYATVMTRQSVADLTSVVTDLRQHASAALILGQCFCALPIEMKHTHQLAMCIFAPSIQLKLASGIALGLLISPALLVIRGQAGQRVDGELVHALAP